MNAKVKAVAAGQKAITNRTANARKPRTKTATPLALTVMLFAMNVSSQAATISNSQVTGSNSGFGQITYTPGTNVNEFVLYGRSSSSASYITSAGVSHIATGVSGDGVSANNNTYNATTYRWTGGSPTASGTFNTESCQPLDTGFGLTPYTYASISATAPSSAFDFSFFAHDYYAATDLQILVNGTQVGLYKDVMSSSYNQGGGEARNTDFYYNFSFTGATAGDNLVFKFLNMQNLGSGWSNVAFLSSSLNYEAPSTITSQLSDMPNTAPEPTTMTLLAIGGGLALIRRRRRTA